MKTKLIVITAIVACGFGIFWNINCETVWSYVGLLVGVIQNALNYIGCPVANTVHRNKCHPLPSNAENGVWGMASCHGDDSKVNDLCKLQCKAGFNLIGGSEVRCTEEGWVGVNGLNQLPQCKENKCQPLPSNDENGVWGMASCLGDDSKVNDLCKLQCKAGFKRSHGSEVRCTEEGWLGVNGLNQIPQCEQNKCQPLPSNDENGVWGMESCHGDDSKVNDLCKLQCKAGFTLIGGSEVRCTGEGWVGVNGLNQLPQCQENKCHPLPSNDENGVWGIASCLGDDSKVNDLCKLQCKAGFNLIGGSEVRCTEEGWVGVNGLNQIPQCKGIPVIGEEFINRINKTLHGKKANMLFLLDESSSVTSVNFKMEIQFIQALVAAFPLSDNRAAGVISFSSVANVDIPLNTVDTCSFISLTNRIQYSGGKTDIRLALNLAWSQIKTNGVHDLSLVFLITDGISDTEPKVAADQIKGSGSVIFTVGVGQFKKERLIPLSSLDENGVPIFFPIDNFQIFNKVAEYLKTTYILKELGCITS